MLAALAYGFRHRHSSAQLNRVHVGQATGRPQSSARRESSAGADSETSSEVPRRDSLTLAWDRKGPNWQQSNNVNSDTLQQLR